MNQANVATGSDHTRAVVCRLQVGFDRDHTGFSSLLGLRREQRAKCSQKRQKEKKAPGTEHRLGCHAINPQLVEVTGASALQPQNRDSA